MEWTSKVSPPPLLVIQFAQAISKAHYEGIQAQLFPKMNASGWLCIVLDAMGESKVQAFSADSKHPDMTAEVWAEIMGLAKQPTEI